MFNTMQFAVGLLLAENEKKRLLDKGAEVSKNFVVNNSILFGAIGNSIAPAILLQNETHKKDKEVYESIRQNLENVFEKLTLKSAYATFAAKLGNDENIRGKYLTKDDKGVENGINVKALVDAVLNRDTFQRDFAAILKNP